MPPEDNMIVDNEPDNAAPPAPPAAPPSEPPATPDLTPAAEPDGILLDNDAPAGTGTSTDDGPTDTPTNTPPETPDEPETPTVPKPETPEPAPTAPPVETVTDPGEFTPKDYSFDVELADGTTIPIKAPDDISKIPNDADFGSPKNLLEVQAKFNRMTLGLESDRRDYEAAKEQYTKQSEAEQQQQQAVSTIVSEVAYLEGKGKLPPVPPEFDTAEIGAKWNQPEYRDKPGIKERMDLFEFRAKENESRTKLGLPLMSVLEAATQMEIDTYNNKAQAVKDKAAEQRKAKGAMVGGANPSPPTNIPDDMIVGEGGNVRDIGVEY